MLNESLFTLQAEADAISRRSKPSAQDKLRHSTLLSKIATIRSQGWQYDKNGKKTTAFPEARAILVNGYQRIARGEEIRAVQEAGQGILSYGNSNGSSFVPTNFIYSGLQKALKTHSPLFDADKVTFITTDNGASTQVPLADDTSEVATVVTEAASDSTYDNIGGVTGIMNFVYTYRTPKIATTIEFGEDAMADFQVKLIEEFFAERIARGVGADLILGNGTGKPLGLIPSLVANGVTPITAAGSSSDDGGAGTSANSIGSQDLRNLFYSVDRAYRNSPKAAWLMADSTLLAIDSLRDKQNQLMHLVKYDGGQPMLFGKPVYTDPNIATIAASAKTVVFGDLSRWLTRYVPSNTFVQVFNELPGLAEDGKIGWQAASRFGGCLLSNATAQTPINYLVQHS